MSREYMHLRAGDSKRSWREKFFTKLKLIWVRLVLSELGRSKGIKIPVRSNAYALLDSSALFDSGKNFKIFREWNRARNLADLGRYYESVKIRKNLLSDLYTENECDDTYAPVGYDSGFFTGFGHWGFLASHFLGMKLNILPKVKKIALVPASFELNPYLKTILENITLVPYEKNYGWTQIPMHWHFFERLEMFRTFSNFEDNMITFQKIANLANTGAKNCFVQIANEDDDYFFDQMKKYGLRKEDKYVAIHIRENDNTDDQRNVNIYNYLPLIKKIIKMGYKVVRFGSGKVTKLPDEPNFIQLSLGQNKHEDLHISLISNCTMYVQTQSGPGVIAWTLGVPTLTTNHTALGLEINFQNNAVIPKKFVNVSSNKLNNLSTIYSSDLAFQKLPHSKLKKYFNLVCVENSPLEIELAGVELLESIEKKINIEYHPSLRSIHSEYEFPFPVKIPSSFLNVNKNILN